jgi:hypothetical protein
MSGQDKDNTIAWRLLATIVFVLWGSVVAAVLMGVAIMGKFTWEILTK